MYLSPFDHFVKRRLKLAKYLRYVDDFAAFSDDRQALAEAKMAMEDFLSGLRLKMHPVKSQLFETKYGASFAGFRILPDRIRVRNDNLRRSRKRMKELQRQYEAWEIDLDTLVQRLRSWEAHLMHGDTHRLRRKLFDYWVFQRGDMGDVTAQQLLEEADLQSGESE